MSTRRTSPSASHFVVKKSLNGLNLCRQCERECQWKRQTFCSDACVHTWKLRTDPGYLRSCVRKRDHGICATCGLDTVEVRHLYRETRTTESVLPLWPEELERVAKWRGWHMPTGLYSQVHCVLMVRAKVLGFDPGRKTWWDCDHIVPVVEGGGECDLDNCRTLCQPCHKAETRALARRRAAARRQSTP